MSSHGMASMVGNEIRVRGSRRWSLPVPGLDTPEASVPHAPLPCFLVLVRTGLAFLPFTGCSLVVLSAGIGVPEDVSVLFGFMGSLFGANLNVHGS